MDRVLVLFKGFSLYLLNILICSSIKYELIGIDSAREMQKNKSVILAFYHGLTFPVFFYHRKDKANILVTNSHQGKVLGVCARLLGYKTHEVEEDLNTRKSAVAVAKMIKNLKNHEDGAIAVDGPSGPRHEIKPGIFYIAQKANAQIISVKIVLSKKLIFKKRWDLYEVPFPFSTVRLTYTVANQIIL